MKESVKIGIIICNRYRTCAGGKCFVSLKNRDGAFSIYEKDQPVELVGYTSCDGCPGGNIEYAPAEMIKNGAQIIHLATGFIVGYPPCPHLFHFLNFIPENFGVKTIAGTHPIPEKYFKVHQNLNTWNDHRWQAVINNVLADEKTRLAYN